MSSLRLLLLALLPAAAVPADFVDLLPEASLAGWTRIGIPAIAPLGKQQWSVDAAERMVLCAGDGGHEWLRYDKELADFILEVDWRYTVKPGNPRYNSGIGIRLSPYGEIWHQAQAGATVYLFGSTPVNGILQRFNLREQAKANPVKPAGEWNHFEIEARGERLSLKVNGTPVSEYAQCGLRRGHIGLEAEGYEIAFRNIRLKVLD